MAAQCVTNPAVSPVPWKPCPPAAPRASLLPPKTREQIVSDILEKLTAQLPEDFNMFNLKMAIGENITPYLVVIMQESERFNLFLREIRQDLKEMRMRLDGALNITDKMEGAMDNMIIQKVPGS